MRRWPIVAVVLATATALGLPWVLGTRAERLYRDVLSHLQDQGLEVITSRYERGWFGSSARAELVMTLHHGEVSTTAADLRLHLDSDIDHGPWGTELRRLRPAAARIRSRAELPVPGIQTPPLLLDTLVELDGSGTTRLLLPAMQPQPGSALGLVTSEGAGELSFGPDFASADGRFELATLAFHTGETYQLLVGGLRIEGSGSSWMASLFAGMGMLTVEEMRLRAPEGGFGAGGISIVVEHTPVAELLNARAVYRVEHLQVQGGEYGPSEAVISLARVPAQELVSLQQALSEISALPVTESMAGIAMGAVLTEHLPRLLAPDPGIALERLQIHTPDGLVKGRLSLSVQGLTSAVMAQPNAWLSRILGEGELSLPLPLLLNLLDAWHRRQAIDDARTSGGDADMTSPEMEARIGGAARRQLDAWQRDGWVAEKNGHVFTNLKLADALLTVNGKTLPILGAGAP